MCSVKWTELCGAHFQHVGGNEQRSRNVKGFVIVRERTANNLLRQKDLVITASHVNPTSQHRKSIINKDRYGHQSVWPTRRGPEGQHYVNGDVLKRVKMTAYSKEWHRAQDEHWAEAEQMRTLF